MDRKLDVMTGQLQLANEGVSQLVAGQEKMDVKLEWIMRLVPAYEISHCATVLNSCACRGLHTCRATPLDIVCMREITSEV